MNISDVPIMFEDNKSVLYRTKFSILLTFEIPAIGLTLFIFAFFITHRAQVNTPQNQGVLVLLITNFIYLIANLPMSIRFYYLGYVSPATSAYCTWWTFSEFTLNLMSELLMATISIQRHILIFHGHIFRIRLKRYRFYYLPMLFCIVYPFIFYIYAIILYSCDGTQWNFRSNACGYANCYLVYSKVLGTFDMIVNNTLPIVVIILTNAALVIRVIKQKRRHHQPISWQKQRRLTLQLLSISTLYLFGWLPILIITITQLLNSSILLTNIQADYILDIIYLIYLLLPWVCLGLLPEFTKWIWQHLHHERMPRNIVRPR